MVNIPPTEAKTVRQREQNKAKEKLLPRTHGPFELVQVFENYVVVLEDKTLVPTSIDSCTLEPIPRNVPAYQNPEVLDKEIRFAQRTKDTQDNKASNQLHDDTEDHVMNDYEPQFILIVDHVAHNEGRVMYNVQMSDRSIHKAVDMHDLPYRVITQYWHT